MTKGDPRSKHRMLEAALWYAGKLNWPVFPCHSIRRGRCTCREGEQCKSPGKHPRWMKATLEHGCASGTIDLEQIALWWKKWPDAHIGLATGGGARVWVLDEDPRHGGDGSRADLEGKYGKLPATLQSVTGSKGSHRFFVHPGVKVRNEIAIAPGLDVRGDGGLVILAPSGHISGSTYAWDGRDGIKSPIAKAPPWLLAMVCEVPGSPKPSRQIPTIIPDGKKHKTCVSLAGTMRRRGCTADEIFAALLKLSERFESPVPDQNLKDIANDIAQRYSPPAGPSERVSSPFHGTQPAILTGPQPNVVKKNIGKPPCPPPKAVDGLQIYNTEYEQLPAVIQELLFRGCTLFAGRPKVGKSWLTLQLAIAMASGHKLWGELGIDLPGRVVYCALEEPQSRTAARLKKLMPEADPAALMNLHFIYNVRPLLAGGAADLDAYLTANPSELVIIDTLSAIVQAGNKRDMFRSDYNEVNTIRQIAEKHKTAVLVVTHLRKMGAEYSLDAVAGTTGITAACDAIWVLRRQGDGTSLLEVFCREMEDKDYCLKFQSADDGFGWTLLGAGADMKLSAERKDILDLLREDGPQDPKSIADLLSKNRNTTRALLRKMVADGDLIKVDKKYQIVWIKHGKS